MLGTGLQLGRSQGDERPCNPMRVHRNQQLQRALRSAGIQIAEPKPAVAPQQNREPDNRTGTEECAKPIPMPVPAASLQAKPSCGNLNRFLESTTPSVPAQYLSKTRMRGRKPYDDGFQPFFTLGDLWESFKEWSAYGAGVPLVLNGSDSVVQYYVPYLSAIQIYAHSSRTATKQRRPGEDSDGDYYRDSSSDGSSDCEYERGMKYTREHLKRHHPGMEASLRIDRLSLMQNNASFQEGFSSDDSDVANSQSPCLLFEFLEQDPPYSREPLADKIADLARRFPDLKTLRSCDLLWASWMSVAWYPIYRIPTGPTLKDLDACFLTYHSLSTPIKGGDNDQVPIVNSVHVSHGSPMISLPVFALASYKFKGSVWIPNGVSERQQTSSLVQAADNWLRLLQVDHPDFQFFASHGTLRR
ncbi:uncharacterized protein LOC116264006 [Nymphaea colorata]|nr:uncharacterized protein LOC116264006 [Nymphaea colorata]